MKRNSTHSASRTSKDLSICQGTGTIIKNPFVFLFDGSSNRSNPFFKIFFLCYIYDVLKLKRVHQAICIFVAIFSKDLFKNPLGLRSAVYKSKPLTKALRVPTVPGLMDVHKDPDPIVLQSKKKKKRVVFHHEIKNVFGIYCSRPIYNKLSMHIL